MTALVNAAVPASVIVTAIARPVAEVSAAATQPRFCMRARFRFMVDRSSISLAASAAGRNGPAALMRVVSTSIWGWVSPAACRTRCIRNASAHERTATMALHVVAGLNVPGGR